MGALELRDRAHRLFSYLRDLALLRSKNVRDVDDFEQVIWLGAPPADAAVATVFHTDPGDEFDTWLDAGRVELPNPPVPPEAIRGWVSLSGLRDCEIDEPGFATEIDDVPNEVVEEYLGFLEREWLPWAEEARRLAPAYEFYRELFAMSERRQRLGEVFELVVCLGQLAWNRNGQRIRRHLITTPAEIGVDADTGRISITPSTSEGRNRLELDMLEPQDQGDLSTTEEIRAVVEATDPLALLPDVPRLLTRWVNMAHPSATYVESLEPIGPSDRLSVALAPAVVLRRRGQRTTSELLNTIATHFDEHDGPLPQGIKRLVSTDGDEQGRVSVPRFEDPEVYFPLPSNDEQRQIVDRVQNQSGVLVQGPPGTGKSLTIANLICHFLAQGQKVLVTSHTERALRVLHDKLPDAIKPLCISLLGSDRESIRDLEGAVEEISAQKATWSDIDARRRLTALRTELEGVRSERAACDGQLLQAREGETKPITVGDYTGTNQSIATQLASQRDDRGWIPDSVESPHAPLEDHEFIQLLELERSLPDEAELASRVVLPDPALLVSPSVFEDLVRAEARSQADLEVSRDRFGDLVDELGPLGTEEIRAIDLALRAFVDACRSALAVEGWTRTAAVEVLREHSGPLRALVEAVIPPTERAVELFPTVGDVEVEGLGSRSIKQALSAVGELLEHGNGGGRLRPGLFAPKVVKLYDWVLKELRINGITPTTPEQLATLHARLELADALRTLEGLWNHRIEGGDDPVAISVTRYSAAAEDLKSILGLDEQRSKCITALSDVSQLIPSDWTSVDAVQHLADGVRSVLRFREIEHIRDGIVEARAVVGDDAHPSLQALRASIDQREPEAYRQAMAELHNVIGLAEQHRRHHDLEARLASKAPRLAAALPTDLISTPGDPPSLRSAWSWRQADTRLASLLEPGLHQRRTAQVARLRVRERELLAELSALLAWISMFKALSNEQDQALSAWAVAIKKVGKGTGKYAERYRRTARSYMAKARDAIPAWIMPMYRVAESIDALPGVFDVVIVDEASQSSVESLFLFYLGRQVIVVGDDQQIAPEAVGIDRSAVHRLQGQYLDGIPFSELFSPEDSLFDQANVRFPGRIVLREHFRCMPEIIEFSNQIAYRAKSLIPLRQYGADRLDPIRTVYLEHGRREGSRTAINRPEAEEIVARIEKVCADPRYDSKSIGVISLQGPHQAVLIERMLLDRLGPKEMLARRIVCGDAYAFQGDERHVIFMSMVASPDQSPKQRIGVLSKETDKRRFNVAASRAMDQVWLVHSVRPDDLSASDLRRQLLEYYLNPKIEPLGKIGEIDPGTLNSPFESMFEQAVYLRILARGYRVIPQYRVAGYRIDLVVEGMEGRIAVECDGDRWHGAEQWESDTARQRQLERAGWPFFRISGSEFYRDPDTSLEPLWKLLERRGVFPYADRTQHAAATREEPLTRLVAHGDAATCDSAEPLDEFLPEELQLSSEVLESGFEGPPPSPVVGNIRSDLAPSLDLDVGRRLVHPWKGEAVVVGLGEDPSEGQQLVAIRFDSGDEFTYTVDEYRRAGFEHPKAQISAADEARGLDSGADVPIQPEPEEHSVSAKARAKQGRPKMEPYVSWHPVGIDDPREADRSVISRAMESIVEVEGPITADRLYKLVIRASGSARVTQVVRKPLNRAFFAMHGVVFDEFEDPNTNWPQRVVRVRGSEPIKPRELGPRDLYEVPLNEVLWLAQSLGDPRRHPLEVKQKALAEYGLERLTAKADAYLEAAFVLIDR